MIEETCWGLVEENLNALFFHNTYCYCVHWVRSLKQLACIFCILQVPQEELFFSCLHLVIVGQTSEEICPGACKIQHIIVHNLTVKHNSKLQQKIPDTMSSTSKMATLEQFPSVLKNPHPISSPWTHYSQSSNLPPTEMYKWSSSIEICVTNLGLHLGTSSTISATL